jgi:adenosylhomocysteine nucleosidase
MSAPVLVCFALEGEAKPFRKRLANRPHVHVLVTGMGRANTERAISAVLETLRPAQVFTCGIAGGLNPTLRTGDVIFETNDHGLARQLSAAGARAGTIACVPRVVITRAEKTLLREQTDADVVEMESGFIQQACVGRNIPCATVRSVSDTAHDDLPLDMNLMCDANQNLSSAKLAFAILKAPQKIPALMRLGKNCSLAASKLADVLVAVVGT